MNSNSDIVFFVWIIAVILLMSYVDRHDAKILHAETVTEIRLLIEQLNQQEENK